MATVIGGPVAPHVQALADELVRRFGANIGVYNRQPHIFTYQEHQPTRELALDIFPRSRADGDRIAAWLTEDAVIDRFGIDYRIWWQRIYNREVSRTDRQMADRGSSTANHKDHIHVSAEPTGPAQPGSEGDDELTPEEKAALGRIDQRVKNLEGAMADLHPEVLTALASLSAKVDQLLERQ